MSRKYTKYITLDDNEKCPTKQVGCMNCGAMVGKRKQKKFDHSLILRYFSNTKRKRVYLEDNTYADLILCDKCAKTKLDLVKMEKTMKQAWMQDYKWKYEQSQNPVHKQLKLKRFGLKAEEVIPLSVYKALFKGKKILR